ncbi:MAG: hypothetical protein ACREAA_12355 [Candidatus Polarisedimenticolia bacterium]
MEVSLATTMFLKAVESSQEDALNRMPGLTPDVISNILQYRKTGKHFANLADFRKITKITAANLSIALRPYQAQEEAMQAEGQRKPVAPAAPPGKAGGRQLSRTADPNAPASAAPAPGQQAQEAQPGPIGAVRPGFYGKLPGYEKLDSLDPIKKKEFLELVNREMCACGCHNETLAFCLVNDPACPVVKARVRKIYLDTTGQPPPD